MFYSVFYTCNLFQLSAYLQAEVCQNGQLFVSKLKKSLQNQDLKQVKFGIAFSLHFLPEFSILDPIFDLILEPKIASKASKMALPAYGGSRNVHDASKSKLWCPKSVSKGPSTGLQNASQRPPTQRLDYIVQTR